MTDLSFSRLLHEVSSQTEEECPSPILTWIQSALKENEIDPRKVAQPPPFFQPEMRDRVEGRP